MRLTTKDQLSKHWSPWNKTFGSPNYHVQLKLNNSSWHRVSPCTAIFLCTSSVSSLFRGVLCPPPGQIPCQPSLVPFPPPHPLSLVFVSYSLPPVPLGQINLFCPENLVLGGLECFFLKELIGWLSSGAPVWCWLNNKLLQLEGDW